jgi:hypothetical protein
VLPIALFSIITRSELKRPHTRISKFEARNPKQTPSSK